MDSNFRFRDAALIANSVALVAPPDSPVSGGSLNDRLTTPIGWWAGNCLADRPRGSVPKRLSRICRLSRPLERLLGRTAIKELLPLQPGDVPETFADIEASRRDLGFEPKTTTEDGLARFVDWYKRYHNVN